MSAKPRTITVRITSAPPPGPSTDWSAPGETAGKPDRWQCRHMLGLFLQAGSNPRHPDGRYVDRDAPWSVHRDATQAEIDAEPARPRLVVVGHGRCPTQEEARDAAEACALAELARTGGAR